MASWFLRSPSPVSSPPGRGAYGAGFRGSFVLRPLPSRLCPKAGRRQATIRIATMSGDGTAEGAEGRGGDCPAIAGAIIVFRSVSLRAWRLLFVASVRGRGRERGRERGRSVCDRVLTGGRTDPTGGGYRIRGRAVPAPVVRLPFHGSWSQVQLVNTFRINELENLKFGAFEGLKLQGSDYQQLTQAFSNFGLGTPSHSGFLQKYGKNRAVTIPTQIQILGRCDTTEGHET